jgi:hypothetical protein
MGHISCFVNSQNRVVCAGPKPLLLAEEAFTGGIAEMEANVKVDIYTVSLICLFIL